MAWMMSMMIAAQAAATAPMAGMGQPAVACPATPLAPPPALAGWSHKLPLAAGGSAARAAVLTIGTGAQATLLPVSGVSFLVAPGKPGATTDSGGLFAFTVGARGRYRVALGAGAWIDVVQGGATIRSVAHDHGPDCTGIRKLVDFDLTPGRYLLQLAGSPVGTMPLLVARLP